MFPTWRQYFQTLGWGLAACAFGLLLFWIGYKIGEVFF